MSLGLLSSVLHLANPKNAWRSFSRFRTSWLSREAVFAGRLTPVVLGEVMQLRAARDAGSFLAGAGAVVLFVLIVVSPLIVLALAWILGTRAYRRREERRLLSAA